MKTLLLLLSATVATASVGRAQLPTPGFPEPAQVFLERSYFAPISPTGEGYIFEGAAALHLFIQNRITWPWSLDRGSAWAVSTSFLPVARMSDIASEPVLTPSYRIRPILAQRISINPRARASRLESFAILASRRADLKPVRIHGLSLGATHYSNGQDGCTRQGYGRTPGSEVCVVVDAPLAAENRPNLRDGDFSTTYFQLRYDHRIALRDDDGLIHRQFTASVEGQVHPIGLKPGGINGELAALYGQHQLNGSLEWEFLHPFFGRWDITRLSVATRYRPRRLDGRDWTSTDVEVARSSVSARGVGVFLRARFGGDDYNIRFAERRFPRFFFGAVWEPNAIRAINVSGN